MPKPSLTLVNSSLIGAQILFGLGSVIAALGLPACNPFAFALYREICAGLILLGAAVCFRNGSLLLPLRQNPTRFLLLGLVIYGNQAGVIAGIKLAGGVTAAVWQPSQPIMTAAISMALHWEPIHPWRVVGILVAFGGCAIMVWKGNSDQVTSSLSYVVGNMLFFVNCLCTSLYVILSKKVLKLYHPLVVTAWSYNLAAVFMAVTASMTSISPTALNFLCPDCTSTWHIPPGAWFALLYFILFNSVAAYAILTWANQFATGTLVMGYTVLQPVTAALLTLVLLGLGTVPRCGSEDITKCLNPLGWGSIIGMAGVFVGLYFVIVTEPKAKEASYQELPVINETKHYDDDDETHLMKA